MKALTPSASIATVAASVAMSLTGCSSWFHSACTPPVGGRCSGPESLAGTPVSISADGRTLGIISMCGGKISETQSGDRLLLTYKASAVRQGGLACGVFPLTLQLATPLGSTPVYDSVSGSRLAVTPGHPGDFPWPVYSAPAAGSSKRPG